jgi:hypothetical protein
MRHLAANDLVGAKVDNFTEKQCNVLDSHALIYEPCVLMPLSIFHLYTTNIHFIY